MSPPLVAWLRRRCHSLGPALVAGAILLGASCPARAALHTETEFDAGFVASHDRSIDGMDRFRAAGPFLEWSGNADTGRFAAVRPFWSRVATADGTRTVVDALWPVFTHKRNGRESQWRFLTMLRLDYDRENPDSRERFWLLPVYFSGRDAQGERYLAVFPLGGTIHEFLGRDTIRFVLFPLYATTTVGDLRSTSILWPIYSRTHSDIQDRLRIFPFYGRAVNRHAGTTKTFVLWPFWSHATYADPAGSGFILFPLYGQMMLADQSTRFFLPPFFRFSRTARLHRIDAPWPFFQYRSGLEERLYFWPVWGRKRVGDTSSSFFLWPLVRAKHAERPGEESSSFRVFPVYYSDRDRRAETVSSFRQIWPLVRWERSGDERLTRALSLWPLRRTEAVERSFAPLWTLYRHRASPVAQETEVLWGWYRSRRGEEERSRSLFPLVSWKATTHNGGSQEWTILKGLVGRQTTTQGSTLRLLYFMHFPSRQQVAAP